jgi:hypothetical protein
MNDWVWFSRTTFSWMLGDQEAFQFANDVEDQVIRRTGFNCNELSPLCKEAKQKLEF